jgi:RNA polymerase sigma-70 factor, ECF subfamily
MSVDAAELEQHRAALTGHCYRMLGSPFDADDAVRDTMVRAWRSIDRFDRRSSLRTWLYRIATHVCLDALAHRSRRTLSIDDGPAGTVDGPLDTRPRTHWLEPVPDARAIPADADPAEQAVLRQTLRLAFVAALQQLSRNSALWRHTHPRFAAWHAVDTAERASGCVGRPRSTAVAGAHRARVSRRREARPC